MFATLSCSKQPRIAAAGLPLRAMANDCQSQAKFALGLLTLPIHLMKLIDRRLFALIGAEQAFDQGFFDSTQDLLDVFAVVLQQIF